MKLLYLQKVDDNPLSTVKGIFSWEHLGIEFHGWKIVEGRNTDAVWLATPKLKIFPGEGLAPFFVLTVKIPREVYDELRDLVITEYEKTKVREPC